MQHKDNINLLEKEINKKNEAEMEYKKIIKEKDNRILTIQEDADNIIDSLSSLKINTRK